MELIPAFCMSPAVGVGVLAGVAAGNFFVGFGVGCLVWPVMVLASFGVCAAMRSN